MGLFNLVQRLFGKKEESSYEDMVAASNTLREEEAKDQAWTYEDIVAEAEELAKELLFAPEKRSTEPRFVPSDLPVGGPFPFYDLMGEEPEVF